MVARRLNIAETHQLWLGWTKTTGKEKSTNTSSPSPKPFPACQPLWPQVTRDGIASKHTSWSSLERNRKRAKPLDNTCFSYTPATVSGRASDEQAMCLFHDGHVTTKEWSSTLQLLLVVSLCHSLHYFVLRKTKFVIWCRLVHTEAS